MRDKAAHPPPDQPSPSGPALRNPNAGCYEALAPFYEGLYGEIDAAEGVRQWLLLLEELKLAPRAPAKRRKRLIDVGCGPGWHLAAWHAAGFGVAGLDSSPSMLRLADRTFRDAAGSDCPLLLADIRSRDLPRVKPFNLAVSHFNFLNLFPPEEREAVFQGVSRLVQPGGVWMTDFAEPVRTPDPVREEVSLEAGGIKLRKLGRFKQEAGCYEQRWRGPQLDARERYWFGLLEGLPPVAARTGWRLLAWRAWRPGERNAPWSLPERDAPHHVQVYLRTPLPAPSAGDLRHGD
jgi:SAM-dependent methyltransferase